MKSRNDQTCQATIQCFTYLKIMNDTPETNEAQFGTGRVSVSFARRLETERDEARGERDALKSAIRMLRNASLQYKMDKDDPEIEGANALLGLASEVDCAADEPADENPGGQQ